MAYPKFIVNVEAAIYKDNLWLMVVRSEKEIHAGGTLSMVGGKVEINDVKVNILENALRREIFEEIGIKIFDELIYVESKMFVTKKGNTIIDIVFLCKYSSGTPEVKARDEIDSIKWMTLNQINENKITPPWILESIEKANRLLNQK